MDFCSGKELRCQFEHVLFHLLFVDVSHDCERHLFRTELLLDESDQLVMCYLLYRCGCAEDRSAERMAFEQHLLKLVVDVFGRGVLV